MREPKRLCVACRQLKDKKALIRVATDSNANVVVDAKKKMQSRGAYVCRDAGCIMMAAKRHSFDRALRTEVSEDLFVRLKEEIDE